MEKTGLLQVYIRGTLTVTMEGKTTAIGPGAAAFVHANELHGVHNPGTESAQYFVAVAGFS